MKLKLFITFIIFVVGQSLALAMGPYVTHMNKVKLCAEDEDPENPPEQHYTGRRLPLSPIICTIEEGNILSSAFTADEIITFEVHDLDEIMCLRTNSKEEFLYWLNNSTLSSAYIKFYTTHYLYSGYASSY